MIYCKTQVITIIYPAKCVFVSLYIDMCWYNFHIVHL